MFKRKDTILHTILIFCLISFLIGITIYFGYIFGLDIAVFIFFHLMFFMKCYLIFIYFINKNYYFIILNI